MKKKKRKSKVTLTQNDKSSTVPENLQHRNAFLYFHTAPRQAILLLLEMFHEQIHLNMIPKMEKLGFQSRGSEANPHLKYSYLGWR